MFDINSNEVEPRYNYGASGIVPPGKYNVVIVDAEVREGGKGDYLQTTWEVIDGPHSGSEVRVNYFLFSDKPKTVQISKAQLSAVMRSIAANLSEKDAKKVMVIKDGDLSPLFYRKFAATIAIREYVDNKDLNEETGEPTKKQSNEVKKVHPYDPTLAEEQEEHEEAEEVDIEQDTEEEEVDEEPEVKAPEKPRAQKAVAAQSKPRPSKRAAATPDWD